MWKRIGQASIWFAIYFGLQNIISIICVVAKFLFNPSLMSDLSQPDLLADTIMDITMDIIMPTMIVSALLMILIYIIYKRVTHQSLDLRSIEWQKALFFTGVACVLNVVTNLSVTLVQNIMPSGWVDSLNESIDTVSKGPALWMVILGTGILIPIMEEITFRYGIHKTLSKYSVKLAFVVSSVLFGLMHGNPIQIVYAIIIGLVFAYVYTKTDNLCYPVIMHMVNNISSLLVGYYPSALSYIITVTGLGAAVIIFTYTACPNVRNMFQKKLAK